MPMESVSYAPNSVFGTGPFMPATMTRQLVPADRLP